jgi:hypothetical protein
MRSTHLLNLSHVIHLESLQLAVVSIDLKLKQTTFVSPRLKCNISDSGKD